MTQKMLSTAELIAKELQVRPQQVEAAIALLDEGATIPFIARYRKEATQNLDDQALRTLAERLVYIRELDERKEVVLQSIREQEKLTPELEQHILAAMTKTRLEDLYLPYKPKRRTKAQIAIEAGLEPLAKNLLQEPSKSPQELAKAYINAEAEILDEQTALDGARHILMDHLSEDAELLNQLREYLWRHALVKSKGETSKKDEISKFSDYFNYEEAIRKIPSHRALALFRGRREGVLKLKIELPEADASYGEDTVLSFFNIGQLQSDSWLLETIRMTWKIKLLTKLELELMARLRELADEEAISVFSKNLRDLMLAAPAGSKVTMGLDPGIRTGVKVVVVDNTGKLLDYSVVYPFAPQNEWHQSITSLAKLIAKYQVELVSIGNGTGSRETERLVTDLNKMYPDLKTTKVMVSEAGASVYSASVVAQAEFPDLDVTLRGAVSIARRLQDPLAELVKIDAKSIGVGQYQHDVNQSRLARSLEGVVEDCVNSVGVDLNMASTALLSHISGLNETLAKNIVQYRDEHGAFTNREQLKLVSRMGEKAFQQSAGFLRIMSGDNLLDASCVHPEAYSVVEKIIADKDLPIKELIGNKQALKSINAENYVDEQFGLLTIKDILCELEKPGRDPRPEFKTARFQEGIEDIKDLQVGMVLEGVVSNVTNFGAFVDIGVHQDGLVHISSLTDKFVSDPHKVVKAGDIITVKVIEVDKTRRRIGLSMRLGNDKSEESKASTNVPKATLKKVHTSKKPEIRKDAKVVKKAEPQKKTIFNTAMADALSKLKQRD